MMPKIMMLLERQNMINIPTAIQNRIKPISRFKEYLPEICYYYKICRNYKKEFPFWRKAVIIEKRLIGTAVRQVLSDSALNVKGRHRCRL